MIIMLNEARKSMIEIKKGNNFGPTELLKNGASNRWALAKKASAIKAIIIPINRADIQ